MNPPGCCCGAKPRTQSFDTVWKDEKSKLGITDSSKARGLALSGGGIRSASFGLGVIQALSEHGILQKMDYLSTVSGGGYIGASLTWYRLHHPNPDSKPSKQSLFDEFNPFGDKGEGVRSEGGKNNFLAFLRQHGNYLNPIGWLDFTSAVSVALRNLLLSLLIYASMIFLILSSLMIVEYKIAENIPSYFIVNDLAKCVKKKLEDKAKREKAHAHAKPNETPVLVVKAYNHTGHPIPIDVEINSKAISLKTPTKQENKEKKTNAGPGNIGTSSSGSKYDWLLHTFFQVNLLIAGELLLAFILYGLAFSISTLLSPLLERNDEPSSSYLTRSDFQFASGLFIKAAGIFLLLAVLPVADVLSVGWTKSLGLIGSISGIWAALSKFRKFLGKESFFKKLPWIGDRLFELGALVFIFGILAFCYHTATAIGVPITLGDSPGQWMWPRWWAVFLAALALALIVNINYASLGRMYRDRLMETFLPNDSSVQKNRWGYALDAHATLLEEMCPKENQDQDSTLRKPLHLINTNVILTNSLQEKYRRRGGDSFLLSPLYCGSDATQYVATASFMKSRLFGVGGMRLATAMAISGAAANPHTGIAGKGPTRGPLVSMLMTLFNLRLGSWVPNPDKKIPIPMMNYIVPGLCGLLPFGHNENACYLELTDGGHYENLGIYELVRRRVGRIIVADAGVDKDFKFGDLANAVEKVRTDFGVSIRFSPEDQSLDTLLPGSATRKNATQEITTLDNLAERGYIIGKVKYPQMKGHADSAFTGMIVVLKTTMVKDLPIDLYSYRANHPDFPDQPTGDQFFDERQFEAYRELGYRIADDLCTNYKKCL